MGRIRYAGWTFVMNVICILAGHPPITAIQDWWERPGFADMYADFKLKFPDGWLDVSCACGRKMVKAYPGDEEKFRHRAMMLALVIIGVVYFSVIFLLNAISPGLGYVFIFLIFGLAIARTVMSRRP